MAGITTLCATNILKLVLTAVAYANIADNTATSPLTNFYFTGHTADPGATGTAVTNETSYTSYARQAVARSTAGFTVAATGIATLVANVVFPISTSGTPTLTHFGVVSTSSSTGALYFMGAINPNIVVSTSYVQTLAGGTAGISIQLS